MDTLSILYNFRIIIVLSEVAVGGHQMTVGEALSLRVNELLEEKKITQYRLSILSGVSQASIGDIRHIRNKTVNIGLINAIAQGLGMDLATFFDSPLFKGENITD